MSFNFGLNPFFFRVFFFRFFRFFRFFGFFCFSGFSSFLFLALIKLCPSSAIRRALDIFKKSLKTFLKLALMLFRKQVRLVLRGGVVISKFSGCSSPSITSMC